MIHSIYQLCIICLMIHKMNPTKSNNGHNGSQEKGTMRVFTLRNWKSSTSCEEVSSSNRERKPRKWIWPISFFFVSTRTFFFLSRLSLDHLIESQYSKYFYLIDKISFQYLIHIQKNKYNNYSHVKRFFFFLDFFYIFVFLFYILW